MGTWPFLLFSTFFALMIITQESVGDEDKSCLTWTCAGKRALEQLSAGRINSRREKQFQKMYDALEAHNEIKKSRIVDAKEEAPCLSWHCRRKRRELVPTSRQPTAEDAPCLTPDCRVGKRSKVGSTPLVQKLQLKGQSEKTGPGCLSWHCQEGKRISMDQSYNVKQFTRDWNE